MIQLIYSSAATVPFSEQDLVRLLQHSRERNQELEISGMLLYYDDSFLQILEGPEKMVEQTFERISDDPRHRCVQLLVRASIHRRVFGDWKMGFVHARRDWLKDLPGYTDFFASKGLPSHRSGDLAVKLLSQFRFGKWRRKVEVETSPAMRKSLGLTAAAMV